MQNVSSKRCSICPSTQIYLRLKPVVSPHAKEFIAVIYSLLQDYKDRPDDLNLNCTDPLGRTSLVIAIENESFELIEVLLEGGIKVSDGLLHAISEDYVEAVELLLEWEERNHKEGNPYVCFNSIPYLNNIN